MTPDQIAISRAARREDCAARGTIEIFQAHAEYEQQPEIIAKRTAEEQARKEREEWIASLPQKVNEWTQIINGEICDQIGNYICSLPKTGSSIEQIIASANAMAGGED
jgi:actin-related protein